MTQVIEALKHLSSLETTAKYGHRIELSHMGVHIIFAEFLLGERVGHSRVITWGELEHLRITNGEDLVRYTTRKFHEGITRLVMEHKAEERRKKG